MRILICGGRNYTNKERIKEELENLIKQDYFLECVIEGEANGADKLGREAAEELNIPVLPFPADWKKYGKSAGPIRNQQMLDEGKPDYILAFHENIEESKSTMDMLQRALKFNIRYQLIK